MQLREARPERIHFVRYEDLVTAPVDTVRRVADFLGISSEGIDPSAEWNFGQVDPDAMRGRPSWSGLYGKPITSERIGRHREVLTPEQIATIKADTADLGALFGYGPNR